MDNNFKSGLSYEFLYGIYWQIINIYTSCSYFALKLKNPLFLTENRFSVFYLLVKQGKKILKGEKSQHFPIGTFPLWLWYTVLYINATYLFSHFDQTGYSMISLDREE